MDDKESTDSGSPGGNPVSESPPSSAGGVNDGVAPQVRTMNMGGSQGVTVGGGVVGSGVVVSTVVGGVAVSGDIVGKKKRGRPRKYDSDGNLTLPYIAAAAATSPQGSVATPSPPGFSLSYPSSQFSSSKRGRGRPPGSGNWQLLASLGELFANTAGGDFIPHVMTVHSGEDVAGKIISFAQKGPRGICILSANGAVSSVTICQPGSAGGILTYEGRFEILALTGSFVISENGGVKSRTGRLSVSLAGPDGRVIGGGIAGLLLAASPIQIVVGSFISNGFKAHKRKHSHEYQRAPASQGALATVTEAEPISQAAPAGNAYPNPSSQLPVQNDREEHNPTTNRGNPNPLSADAAGLNGSMPASDQKSSPDINLSLSVE